MTRQILFAGLCSLAMWPAHAHGALLAPPLVSGSLLFNRTPPDGVNFFSFGTFASSGPGGSLGFHSAPSPIPSLQANVSLISNFYGRSSGTLIYEMQLSGPADTVAVLVHAAGSVAGSSITDDPFAVFALKATWSLFHANSGQFVVLEEGIQTPALQGSFSQSFSNTRDLVLKVGDLYRITMVADAGAAAGSGANAHGFAFIDPLFTFAPGVGQEFSFLFSEGIGNSAAALTPEPGTMAMIGVAAWLLGLRRRRG
ncbi:MAG: PEP-CTERM sorting domain-containing protein [Bryobacterales bacterium]|nr:PEP-CTERM sorting domain-containing protein [Bryobacterales bacterium]